MYYGGVINDGALAKWHALNERMKKKIRTCRGLKPGLLFAGRELYYLATQGHSGLKATLDKSRFITLPWCLRRPTVFEILKMANKLHLSKT